MATKAIEIGLHDLVDAAVSVALHLVTRDEKLLWTRLSVFLDGCDLAAAEDVCAFGTLDGRFVVDLLDNLVAKSIVQADPRGLGMRYRMLVTIREYGSRLAMDAGEWDELRRRHRDLYLARARMVQHWPGATVAQHVAMLGAPTSWRRWNGRCRCLMAAAGRRAGRAAALLVGDRALRGGHTSWNILACPGHRTRPR